MHVVYFPYDTTRAREEDLTNVLTRLMQEAPPDSVGVVDTMGCALPEAIKHMVRWVNRSQACPSKCTPTTTSAWPSRPSWPASRPAPPVSIVRQRAGRAYWQRGARGARVALHVLYGYDKQYNLAKLPELGEWSAASAGLPIAVNKPILGARNFTRESGIGVDLVVKEPLAMFGTHPALTGREGEVVLGKKSGKAVDHIQPREARDTRSRGRSDRRDAQARERQRHREARVVDPGGIPRDRR